MLPDKARLLSLWDNVRSSYWFIPSIMAVAAAVLSVVVIRADLTIGADWIEGVEWLSGNRPSGARAVLSTIAGSMIGVAGVTFSITIASVVYASGQYGPRLLSNFMSDRGNQVTLGTFIATFLYCLLVLRTIRNADEGVGPGVADAFVPQIAVLTALALALASVGVLIFFIHHVPESIHVSNVIAGIGRDLHHRVDTLFPERIAAGAPAEAVRDPDRATVPDGFFDEAARVLADGSGYVRAVDTNALLRIACEQDLVVWIRHRPGDFVSEGDTLVLAWPPDRSKGEELRRAFAWGSQRTARQDVRFLFNELVEIAARALSPGVNDPFTAVSCLDWLGAALKRLAGREFPVAERLDEDGTLRVVARPTSFEEFVGGVFGQLRPYLAADRNAALHALKTLGEVASQAKAPAQRALLREHADALLDGVEAVLEVEADKEDIRQRHRTLTRLLSGHVEFEEAAAQTAWIGGTS